MKKITTVAAALALMTSSLLPTSVLAQEGQLNLPEFQDLGDGSENLALNMKVSASSNEGTAGRFENAAVDGNMSTRWASRAGTNDSDVDQTWYCVDLGKVMDINRSTFTGNPDRISSRSRSLRMASNGVIWAM